MSQPFRVVAAAVFALTLSVASSARANCSSVSIPVSLAAGAPKTETVKGTLCLPFFWAKGKKSVELLVHGATYNKTYWDWPTSYPFYSYQALARLSGRATLAVDRLGYGSSSKPPAALLNVASTSYVLHQVVSYLRAAPNSYQEVTATGHSVGAEMVNAEAATYHDVDRVVLTGYLHRSGEGVPDAIASTYPAMLDPKFAGQILDPLYLTTLPGSRANIFFYVPTTSPAVLLADELLKDTVSAPELGDALAHYNTPAPFSESRAINVPVLVVVGDEDRVFCGAGLDCKDKAAVVAYEQPFFTSAPSLDVEIIRNTGHCLTEHYTAPATFAVINNWINQH